ncbi:MAG: sigma-70 family RNA polymerase sigma factor [bacterium]|nr:sigma-70 family RNA polymerase sigma factor [bacterium]
MAISSSQLEIHRADSARVDGIVSGGHETFRDLVVEYHPLAFSLAYRSLGDPQDAEEVVQDAFVKIHGALDGFRGDASLKTWILRIVWRLSLNRRRDRARSSWRRLGLHQSAEDADVRVAGPVAESPEARLLSREAKQLIRELVDGLPPTLREVLILNSFEELGYEEIARILGIPVGTVSSRIHAARRKLARRLQKSGPNERIWRSENV